MPNEIVQADIQNQISQLVAVADIPEANLGYGSDLACTNDIDEKATELDGLRDSVQILGEALYRRAVALRGSLADDRDYGLGLPDVLSEHVTQQQLSSISGRIRLELEKDDRVGSIAVQTAYNNSNNTLAITIRAEQIDIDGPPFSLTLSVTDSEVLLEEIRGLNNG